MTDNEIMTFEKAMFILRHGSAEGEHKYFEAIKVIEEEVNRQKAKIARYEKENDEKFDKWKILDERTKERYSTLYEEAKAILKVETIKEFAERLKKRAWIIQYSEDGIITPLLSVDDIDNLLKEMVGEDDE